jgi:hypothetical protein
VSVPIANGGTNATTIGSAGSVPYSTGTAYAFSAVGTTGQALISGGSGSPTWYAPTAGSVLFAGTGGILQQDNANYFWDDTNNRLGIGTTAPENQLQLLSSSALNNGLVIANTNAGNYNPIIQFELAASTPLFSLGVDDSDSDKFKISTGSDITGTSQFTIDSTGTVSIGNLNLGATMFDTDAGLVSWVDMPVTASATAGTIEGYIAQIDGNPLLTISSSYVMLGTALYESFHIDYHVRPSLAWLLGIVPPILIFLSGLRNFIDVVGLVGAVSGGVQAVLLLAAYLRARRTRLRDAELRLRFPSIAVWVLMAFFAAGAVHELLIR